MSACRARPSAVKRPSTSRAILLAGAAVLATLGISTPASAAITSTSNANNLANAAVVGGGVSGATLETSPLVPDIAPNAVADSASPLGDFPTEGTTYTILTSGDPQLADDPNEADNDGVNLGDPDDIGRGDTAFDISTLAVPVTVPGGMNCLALQYRFLSEEFPEFVDSEYNDAFIAELDTSNWTTSGSQITAPNDFAANTGDPVSVNGVGPVAVSPAESAGTTYDAATGLVTTKTPITSGAHTVYLSIFDQDDQIYDSAVFLDNLRFLTESAATCKPPEVAKTPPTNPPTNPPAGISVGPDIKFKGSSKAVITVNVPGPGTITAKDASASGRRASASKKKKALIKQAVVEATQAGPVEVTISLAKAGKKALKKKGKAKVQVQISFTPTGAATASSNTTQKIKFKKKKKN